MNSLEVKVIGSGCKNCKLLHANVLSALKKNSIEANVEYVSEPEKIIAFGVMKMPALIVNGKTVSSGKLLSPKEAEKILLACATAAL